MITALFILAASLGYAHAIPKPILNAIETTVPDEDMGRLMLVWGIHETGLHNEAVGDGGKSLCWLQIQGLGNLDEMNCAKAWLGLLRYDEKLCGSRRAALGALATGHCGGAKRLVQKRLDEAGVVLP
jgi:hypothetical protein